MDTLKFAAAAADAIKAPVCALSCTPNSIPISAGGLLIDRSWEIKLAAAGVTAAVASLKGLIGPLRESPVIP